MAAQSYGLIATFETAAELYHAAEKVRDAGFRNWDCITPFPVHGLDKAMGLRRSIVPRISLAGGITGFCTGMSLIYFADAYANVVMNPRKDDKARLKLGSTTSDQVFIPIAPCRIVGLPARVRVGHRAGERGATLGPKSLRPDPLWRAPGSRRIGTPSTTAEPMATTSWSLSDLTTQTAPRSGSYEGTGTTHAFAVDERLDVT